MKHTLLKLILLMAVTSTLTLANVLPSNVNKHTISHMTPGMKIFRKKMRKGCRSTAIKFSRAHTQEEWNIIRKNGLLRRAAKTICPHLDTSILSNKDLNHIYSFVNDNAKDNPVILKC